MDHAAVKRGRDNDTASDGQKRKKDEPKTTLDSKTTEDEKQNKDEPIATNDVERNKDELKDPTETCKKEAPTKHKFIPTVVIPLEDFSFANLRFQLQGDGLEFTQESKQPIFIRCYPNGIIPHGFGIQTDTTYGRTSLCTNVDNQETQRHFARLCDELNTIALAHGESWQKSLNRPKGWIPKFGPLLEPSKKPKFSPILRTQWDPQNFKTGKLRVRNKDDGLKLVRSEVQIPGSKCSEIVFQLVKAWFGKGDKLGGISKNVSSMVIEKNLDFWEWVNSHDYPSHPPECTMKHIHAIDLKTLDCERDLEIHEMDFSQPVEGEHRTPTARITLKGSDCPVYLRASGGGAYPKFAMSYFEQHKSTSTTFGFSDNLERDALKKLGIWLKKKTVELRDAWFKDVRRKVIRTDGDGDDLEDDGVTDDTIRSWAQGLLCKATQKKDKDKNLIPDQYWPPNLRLAIDKTDFQEPFFNGPEKKENRLYNLKPNSSYRVVDADGNCVTDLGELKYKMWEIQEFTIRNIYLQPQKVKFATKHMFTKLAHSSQDYVPMDEHEEE